MKDFAINRTSSPFDHWFALWFLYWQERELLTATLAHTRNPQTVLGALAVVSRDNVHLLLTGYKFIATYKAFGSLISKALSLSIITIHSIQQSSIILLY